MGFCVRSIQLIFVIIFGRLGRAKIIHKEITSHTDEDDGTTYTYWLTLRYGENAQFSDRVTVTEGQYRRCDKGSIVEIKYIGNTAMLWQGRHCCDHFGLACG